MVAKSDLLIFLLVGIVIYRPLYSQISPLQNTIAVDITTPQNKSYNYDSSFLSCYNLGMRMVGLHFAWRSDIESTPGIFSLTNFDIANVYYPAYNVSVNLNIDPIETDVLELPDDIANLPFNDSTVIKRFKILLESIFYHIPKLTVSSLVIGSEVDSYLGTDSLRWSQYISFFSIVSDYAKTLRPGLKIACEASYGGISGLASKYIQRINELSDVIGISYYPLNSDYTVEPVSVVKSDFSNVVDQYPSKPVYYYQLGYPSSQSCKSSLLQQAQFIQMVFDTWDTYPQNIKMINFTWLHDISDSAINYYSSYYGVSDTIFLAYLGSIGLQSYNGNGRNKPAFTELQCQAKQRGYNSLTINCPDLSSINQFINNENSVKIYPNPLQNNINIETTFNLNNAEVVIYNLSGVAVKNIQNVQGKSITIESGELSNGIYFLDISNDNKHIYRKFIKVP